MQLQKDIESKTVTELLNGTLSSIKTVVPIGYDLMTPRIIKQNFNLHFGVLIGITGDVIGKLVLTGSTSMFSSIGEKMYGMPLEGEMLVSFSGELGNMIAGGLSTNIAESGTIINITSPTVMNGNTTLSGYNHALEVPILFKETGKMHTYLLLD